MKPFSYTPLTAPLNKKAVKKLQTESNAAKIQPNDRSDTFFFGMSIASFVLTSGILAFVNFYPTPYNPGFQIEIYIFDLIFGYCDTIFLLGIILSTYRLATRWGEYYRALQFAATNQMTYTTAEPKPTWDCILFNIQTETWDQGPRASSVFTSQTQPTFETGNYQYPITIGTKKTGRNWGYIVANLATPKPAMVLRSKSKQSAKRWAMGAYSKHPILSLGATADKTFTLYCPAGAEDAARQIFTPQVIKELKTLGKSIDVEIKDNHMFVYSSKPFKFPRAKAIKNVFTIIATTQTL